MNLKLIQNFYFIFTYRIYINKTEKNIINFI